MCFLYTNNYAAGSKIIANSIYMNVDAICWAFHRQFNKSFFTGNLTNPFSPVIFARLGKRVRHKDDENAQKRVQN